MTEANALTCERLAALDGLRDALARAGLPVADLEQPGRMFFRFVDRDRTVGYGGLEGAAPDMLLRSIVVEPRAAHQGHGGRIVAALERAAAGLGATHLHLLTTTAADFFARHGYAHAERYAAPPAVAECEQFRSICPASAGYLVKRIGP